VLLCLLAAVLAAVSVIIQKPVLRKFPAAQATWFGILVGALCCLPFTGQLVSEVRAAPPEATLGLLYLGVFPTAIAFTTWAYALSLIDAGKLAATTYLVPGTTILISWLLLGEIPTALGLVGGLVCLVGVGLTRRRSRTLVRHATPAGAAGQTPGQAAGPGTGQAAGQPAAGASAKRSTSR
jgi:drug/metabolite transporter (DMT)-like permease